MKKFIFITFVLASFLASAEQAFACSCFSTDEPIETKIQKAYKDSAVIFSGEVVRIEPKGEFYLTVRINAARVWKGTMIEQIPVITAKQSAMCGFDFEVGKKYLIYTNHSEDGLMVSSCSRTAILDANEDVEYLEELLHTEQNPEDVEPGDAQKMPYSPPKKRLKSGVAVKSTIGGESHDSYVISVKKGQILKVKISWKGNLRRNAEFFVSKSPDFFAGKPIRGRETSDGKNWQYKIRESGDYYIYVTAYPTADYILTATVK